MARTAFRRLVALGLLGGLSALWSASQAASMVWAVRGAHGTLYLAGSVHLLPAQDASLPPALEQAYRASGKLVMELDLGKLDQAQLGEWMQQHGALPAGSDLQTLLGQTRYVKVRSAVEGLGLPQQLIDTQAPWLIGLEVAELEYARLGFDPQQGVEEQLVRRAQADGKATAGLETVQEELGGLESLPPKEQLRLLDQSLEELKDAPEEMRAVLSAWRRGDATELARLLEQDFDGFPTLYEALVSSRNRHWLPQIEAYARGNGDTLVVVGALHLVGPGGLLELLRKDGFTPTQLP
jgi:uncharacterized protein